MYSYLFYRFMMGWAFYWPFLYQKMSKDNQNAYTIKASKLGLKKKLFNCLINFSFILNSKYLFAGDIAINDVNRPAFKVFRSFS